MKIYYRIGNEQLRTNVVSLSSLESAKENTPLKNTIVPDRIMKLIFQYRDAYKHHPNNKKGIVLPKIF